MSEHRDIEEALRASLAEHARQAPTGAGLVDDIVAAAARPRPTDIRRARQWGTWTLPLIAAGAVAAVAVALVGVTQLHHSANKPGPPAGVTHSVLPPNPVTTGPSPTSVATTNAGPPSPNGGKNFMVTDVSFVGDTHGWALGTANCFTGLGVCTELLRTTDGASWHVLTNPPVNITQVNGCTSRCAQGIRFATDQIGYAFGQNVFFMTTDGGAHWVQQPGGAAALETLDGNVIRVSTTCSPGCPYTVQTAPIGTSTWTTVPLPGTQAGMNSGVALVRTGQRAFIDVFGHVSGGASDARSVMYSSIDDGASWSRRGEPCPQTTPSGADTEVDSTELASAADGSVTLLCTPRVLADSFTITSTDGGQTFVRGAGGIGAHGGAVLGAASASTLFVSSDVLYRSTDGGATWHRVQVNGVGPPNATWIGFETASVGRVIAGDTNGRPHVIWTTRDAGRTWSAHIFQ
ncbi:MAG TPA: hypothetical protein VGN35_08125 [Jatrophihabitantaceae bacterium]|nr:hypothetical protein [Jatrophihabitantaceae bacterium]